MSQIEIRRLKNRNNLRFLSILLTILTSTFLSSYAQEGKLFKELESEKYIDQKRAVVTLGRVDREKLNKGRIRKIAIKLRSKLEEVSKPYIAYTTEKKS